MNVSSGLNRIAITLKVLAFLWLLLPLYGWLFGTGSMFTFLLFGGLPSAVAWIVGWIIQGFAQPR